VAQGLSNAFITSVLGTADGSMWLGSFEGLNRWFDGRNTIYRERRSPAASREGGSTAGAAGLDARAAAGLDGVREITGPGLPAHGVHALAQDRRGRLWVATREGVGFIEHDRFTSISGIPGGNFNAIAEDPEDPADRAGDPGGAMWVAHSTAGLFEVREGRSARLIPAAALGRDDPVSVLVGDAGRGGMWLGFARGGVAFMRDGRVRESFETGGEAGGASAAGAARAGGAASAGGAARAAGAGGAGRRGRVSAFQLDRDGTLWAATSSGLWVLKEGRVRTMNSTNGLPCDTVHWVIEDDAHSFWLFMPCGLVRVARSELENGGTLHPTVHDNGDGVRLRADAGTYTPLVSKSLDGRIWFASVNGAGVIDPRRLPFNTLPPPVRIERLAANRSSYDASASAQTPLALPPLIRDLEIDYTALSLVAPEKVRFRCMLEGFDQGWQDVGGRRQAFYTNLAPGRYRFRVVASNNSGVWNEAGAFIDFSIAPAYYQATWFRAVLAGAVLTLLGAFYQCRVRQIARAFEVRLQERVNERTRIARDLHDTLLQGFHGLLFRFQAVSNLLPARPLDAKQQLDSAIDQVAQAITDGRDAVQNLRGSTVVTNDLAPALETVSSELAAAHTGDVAAPLVEITIEGVPRDLHPIVRDDVFRIASEALRNAFRHACARHIEVAISYGERQLQVSVRDDGKGLDSAAQEARRVGHFGLAGMRERAEIVGGRLEVWSHEGLGTEIQLTIPAAAAYAPTHAHRSRWWLFARRVGTSS
jgi:signal transduction histidine kinase